MEIKRCKYAFDREDSDCAKCNGVSIEVNGEVYPATKCRGYIADIKSDFETVNENNFTKEKAIETIEDIVEEELPFEMEEKSESKPPVPYQRKNQITPTSESEKDNEGITTKLTFMSGATISLNGDKLFYKFECTEERFITEDMDVAAEREKLWATVNSEIDRQLQEVIETQK